MDHCNQCKHSTKRLFSVSQTIKLALKNKVILPLHLVKNELGTALIVPAVQLTIPYRENSCIGEVYDPILGILPLTN